MSEHCTGDDCKVCAHLKRIAKTHTTMDIEWLRNLAIALIDEVSRLDSELSYRKLILSGDWPGSINILKKALLDAEWKYEESLRQTSPSGHLDHSSH
jgi:hypothetical protein